MGFAVVLLFAIYNQTMGNRGRGCRIPREREEIHISTLREPILDCCFYVNNRKGVNKATEQEKFFETVKRIALKHAEVVEKHIDNTKELNTGRMWMNKNGN